MMFSDCHVHTGSALHKKEDFIGMLDKADVSKVMLHSYHPEAFEMYTERPTDRLQMVIDWANAYPDRIYPLHWLDPLEEDAFEQVDRAVALGIRGFKVICNHFYPGDDRPMRVWEHIAKAGKPIHFHSGGVWAGRAKSKYCLPVNFEPVFDVKGLRFMMAHISWPWCDECLAVYGKWSNRKSGGYTDTEMFLNMSPGPGPAYRKDLLYKIYNIGYDLEDNILFGASTGTSFGLDWYNSCRALDIQILNELGLTTEQQEKYFCKNMLRFLGE